MSFLPRMSLPLTVKRPFESIAGRNRCVSKPPPLVDGIAFGVFCARASRGAARRETTSPAPRQQAWTARWRR